MLHVEVENFQAIEKASLDFDGVSVIIGETNVGKSALLRAIYGALRNIPGGTFVRDGAKKCRVKLSGIVGKDGNPHTIVWEKAKSGSAKYELDGTKYSAIGRGTFEELEKLGFGVEQNSDPMFHKQGDPPFMLHDPSEAVDIISSAKIFLVVQNAMSMASSERSRVTRERGVLQRQRDELLKELEVYEKIDLEEVKKLIETVADRIEERRQYRDGLLVLQARIEEARSVLRYVELARKLEAVQPSRFVEVAKSLHEAAESHREVRSLMQAMLSISFATKKASETLRRAEAVVALQNAFECAQEVSGVKDEASRCSRLHAEVLRAQSVADLLLGAVQVRALKKSMRVVQQAGVVSGALAAFVAAADVQERKRKLQEASEKLSAAKEEFHKALERHGVCPYCGQKVGGD